MITWHLPPEGADPWSWPWGPRAGSSDEEPSFTCPRCGRTSYHPDDIAAGYCGACHDWTGPGDG